ncbi:ABC transporter ATP-binding protein [Paenibacillus sp. FSL W8-0194]|uniref:ABC transporter ATP-binding protein n=1 Tax=Paenibacillus sp. FSL W8-0194 TaxID=2921711 RepID=UPI0030DB5B90
MALALTSASEGYSGSLIEIRNASKTFGRRKVLQDISLEVMQGEGIALIGRNGSGKSTLLRLLAGLTQPTSGTREVRQGRNGSVGYVPERFPPLPFTPWDYLTNVAAVRGMDKHAAEDEIYDLLQQLDMEHALHVKMNRFSKGMLQKINLIQGMLGHPDLLLLDEPLSGLDVKAQENLLQLLLTRKREGSAIVMSVHESKLIERAADRVLLIRDGQVAEETREKRPAFQEIARIVALVPDPGALARIAALGGVVGISPDSEACLLETEPGAVDPVLRLILDCGGSVISVTPAGGMDDRLENRLKSAAN